MIIIKGKQKQFALSFKIKLLNKGRTCYLILLSKKKKNLQKLIKDFPYLLIILKRIRNYLVLIFFFFFFFFC